MAQGALPRDANFIPPMGAVSSLTDAISSVRPLQYNPSTRGVTVHIVGGSVSVDTTGLATDTKQDTIISHLVTLHGYVDGIEGLLSTSNTNTGNAATSLGVMDDWDETDRAKVNIIAGQAGVTAGAGAVAASTPRVTLASDDPGVTALQTIDNFISGSRGLVTEDNSASIKTAVETIDNFISGSRGLVTEDNSATMTASLSVMDDWDETDRAKVNIIAGQVGVQGGSGVTNALTQRVVLATDVALPAGTNAIGKLAANNGVDIGDVDVTSIAAGTNVIGDVDIAPRTTGGWSVGNFTSGDTYTALTNSAQVIKAGAGKFGGYYIYNPNSAATYVMIYNIAAASVTVGTSTAKLVFCIPATSGANLELLAGIPFDTAMAIAAATTGGGASAPSSALEAMIFYK